MLEKLLAAKGLGGLGRVNLVLIQGCRFGEAALSRGDLTEVEWCILRVLLPVERKPGKRGPQAPARGQSQHHQRHLMLYRAGFSLAPRRC